MAHLLDKSSSNYQIDVRCVNSPDGKHIKALPVHAGWGLGKIFTSILFSIVLGSMY